MSDLSHQSLTSHNIPKHSISSTALSHSSSSTVYKKWETLRPITDIRISFTSSERIPNGFATCKVLGESNSASSRTGLRISVERAKNKAPITSIVVIYPSRGEFPPPGFQICKGSSDFSGSSPLSTRLCVCWGDGPPLVDLALSSSWPVPKWRTMDQSPLGSKLLLNNAKRGSSGVVICLRYDLRDYRLLSTLEYIEESVLREGDSLRGTVNGGVNTTQPQEDLDDFVPRPLPVSAAGSSESEDETDSASGTRPRKGSLVGQAFASALPLGLKLLQRGQRSASQIYRRDSMPNASTANQIHSTEDSTTTSSRDSPYLTRLQHAFDRAQKKILDKKSGVIYYYDPEVVRLLAPSPEVLKRVLGLILACFDGTVQDSAWALESLSSMLTDNVIYPSNKPTLQMNLFDTCIATFADCIESGQGLLIATAVRACVNAVNVSPEGLHPLSLHRILVSVCTGHDFFLHYREDTIKLNLADNGNTVAANSSPSDTPLHSANPSTVSLMTSASQPDKDITEARNFAVLQACHNIFSDICRRAAMDVGWWLQPDQSKRIIEFENVILIVSNAANCRLDLACDLLVALDGISNLNEAPKAREAVFTVAWLTVYSACGHGLYAIREFIARASEDLGQFASFGYVIRRLVLPMVLDRLSSSDPIKFNDAKELLTSLWIGFRTYLKTEMAVVFSAVIIPSLSEKSPTWRRLAVLELLASWIDQSRSTLVELFLNFENDSPVPHWKLFQKVIECMCTIAEPKLNKQTASPTASQARKYVKPAVKKEASQVQTLALTNLSTCIRNMADLAGTVHTNKKSKAAAGWDEFDGDKVGVRRDEERQRRETLDRALAIAKASGARNAINYLTAAGYVNDSPAAVAQLLRVNQREFGEDVIGDYLGEGGKTPAEQAFMVSLRDIYTRAAPRIATGDSFDEALRNFLTRGGFRLPGESQKVERLLEAFARRYARDNPSVCNEDAALVLAFSVVMLNTDLHRQAIKKNQKMKRDQFVKNLCGVNREGGDFPREFLEGLYDSVARNEIRFLNNQEENKEAEGESEEDEEEELHGHDNDNDNEEDFAEFAQIQVQHGLGILSTLYNEFPKFHFKPSPESATIMFESTSAKFFALISVLLENPQQLQQQQTELESRSVALDMLLNALTVTLFLGLEAEKRAFASLLAKLVYLHCRGASEVQISKGEHLTQSWFGTLMDFDEGNGDNVGVVVGLIHNLVMQLGDALAKEKPMAQSPAASLAERLGVDHELSSPPRNLIKEGTLIYKNKEFSFFLFSDSFIRAVSVERKLTSWALRVLDNLPLRTMRVIDTTESELGFEIRSPVMTLQVQAKTSLEKREWISAIERAVQLNVQERREIRLTNVNNHSSLAEGVMSPEIPKESLKEESNYESASPKVDFAATLKAAKACLLDPSVDNVTKMKLYGLFKQQSKGDCPGEGGDEFSQDLIAKAKWHAWMAHRGKKIEDAKMEFAEFVLKVTKKRCESEV